MLAGCVFLRAGGSCDGEGWWDVHWRDILDVVYSEVVKGDGIGLVVGLERMRFLCVVVDGMKKVCGQRERRRCFDGLGELLPTTSLRLPSGRPFPAPAAFEPLHHPIVTRSTDSLAECESGPCRDEAEIWLS